MARFRESQADHRSTFPTLPASVVSLVNRAMEFGPRTADFGTPTELLNEIKAVQRRMEQADGDDARRSPAGESRLDREGESRRVMIVESNAEMQDVLRDLLKRRGYRVLVIGDAQRALARFEEAKPPATA